MQFKCARETGYLINEALAVRIIVVYHVQQWLTHSLLPIKKHCSIMKHWKIATMNIYVIFKAQVMLPADKRFSSEIIYLITAIKVIERKIGRDYYF